MNFLFHIFRLTLRSFWTILLLDLSYGIKLNGECTDCNGNWSDWQEWSECAGGICNDMPGRMTHMRSCLNDGRNICNQRISKQCLNEHSCLGDWAAWNEWNDCSFNERSQKCEKSRSRKCGTFSNLNFSMCAGGRLQSSENASCEQLICFPTTRTIIQALSESTQNSTKVTLLRSQHYDYNTENIKRQQQKIFVIVGASVGGFVACGFIMICLVQLRNKNNSVDGSRYKNANQLRFVSRTSSATEGYSASGITSPSTEFFAFTLNDLPVRDVGSRSASNVSANNEFTFLRADDSSLTRGNANLSRQENVYWEISDSRRKSMNPRPYSFADELPLSKKLAGSKHSIRQLSSSKQISGPSNQTGTSEKLVVDNILYTTFQP